MNVSIYHEKVKSHTMVNLVRMVEIQSDECIFSNISCHIRKYIKLCPTCNDYISTIASNLHQKLKLEIRKKYSFYQLPCNFLYRFTSTTWFGQQKCNSMNTFHIQGNTFIHCAGLKRDKPKHLITYSPIFPSILGTVQVWHNL